MIQEFYTLVVGLALFFCAGSFAGCSEIETPVAPTRYTVVRGDTLTRIARQHAVEVSALRVANGISGDLIEVGLVLLIPGDGSVGTPSHPSKRARSALSGKAHKNRTTKGAALALHLPPRKACLAAPTLSGFSGGEPEMAASKGLTGAQVSAAMEQALKQIRRCITGDWPVGVIGLQIEVACTGRVAQVLVSDAGGMDAALVACVKDTLRYTDFPAHDIPDGFSFGYPMRFEGGG